jgi:acetyl esterase/lipase
VVSGYTTAAFSLVGRSKQHHYMKIKTLLFSLFLYGMCAQINGQTPEPADGEIEVTPLTLPGAETFVFKQAPEGELRLHVVKPKGSKASDKRPCLVAFFGGGWSSGTPEKSLVWAKWATKLGMIGVAPDYRTRKRFQTIPEDSVADGRAAVRWLQDHASELGIDPAKIVCLGSSAGGHVAAWTAIPDPDSKSTPAGMPDPVPAALVLLWPVTDTGEHGYGGRKRFGNSAARAEELSVTTKMPHKMPPTIVFHGTADETVKFENSKDFVARMKTNGNSCELVVLEGAPHSANSTKNGEAGKKIKAQIEEQAKQFLEGLGLAIKSGAL